jgi:hypothetical protein
MQAQMVQDEETADFAVTEIREDARGSLADNPKQATVERPDDDPIRCLHVINHARRCVREGRAGILLHLDDERGIWKGFEHFREC